MLSVPVCHKLGTVLYSPSQLGTLLGESGGSVPLSSSVQLWKSKGAMVADDLNGNEMGMHVMMHWYSRDHIRHLNLALLYQTTYLDIYPGWAFIASSRGRVLVWQSNFPNQFWRPGMDLDQNPNLQGEAKLNSD